MKVKEILAQVKQKNRTILTEIEAKQILLQSGINCTDTQLATTKDAALKLSEKFGFPVVLKVSSVDITHKSDAGGVKVNLQNKAEVKNAYDSIINSCKAAVPNARIEGVTVQGMAKPGVEVIMGIIKDPSFGPVIMFGMGGIFVELFKDVSFRVVPIEKADAEEMIDEIKGKKLLQGYRGQEPANFNSLQQMLLKLSEFANSTPEIKEIDMNPVFANKDGAVVVDARIIL